MGLATFINKLASQTWFIAALGLSMSAFTTWAMVSIYKKGWISFSQRKLTTRAQKPLAFWTLFTALLIVDLVFGLVAALYIAFFCLGLGR